MWDKIAFLFDAWLQYRRKRREIRVESLRSRRTRIAAELRQEYRDEIEVMKREIERLQGQVLILTEHRDLYVDLLERERVRVRSETAELIRREETAKLAIPQEITL